MTTGAQREKERRMTAIKKRFESCRSSSTACMQGIHTIMVPGLARQQQQQETLLHMYYLLNLQHNGTIKTVSHSVSTICIIDKKSYKQQPLSTSFDSNHEGTPYRSPRLSGTLDQNHPYRDDIGASLIFWLAIRTEIWARLQ